MTDRTNCIAGLRQSPGPPHWRGGMANGPSLPAPCAMRTQLSTRKDNDQGLRIKEKQLLNPYFFIHFSHPQRSPQSSITSVRNLYAALFKKLPLPPIAHSV